MRMDFTRVLLVSLVSNKAFGPSAFAMMYQVPAVVPAGIVTLFEPWLLPPETIGPVKRDPRTVSPPTSSSDDRRKCVVDCVVSLRPATLAVVSVKSTESPAPDLAGAPSASR